MDGPNKVHLVGIVDWDPAGAIIAKAFQEQLAQVGLPDSTLTTLVRPERYSRQELEMFKFPLPSRRNIQSTKNRLWVEKTGGIDGKPFGLEAESMPWDRLWELTTQAVDLVEGDETPG